MTHESKRTHDPDTIKQWVEDRGGRPAIVADTQDDDSGVLRIDFGEKDEDLEEIDWDRFFRIFEENNLDFLYQEETAEGSESRFFKFVERE